MKKLFCPKPFLYVALIFWLLVSISGIQGHFCFDGKEPPISIHSDLMSGHPEHHADEAHVDADGDLFGVASVKFVKIDVLFLIAALVFLVPLHVGQRLFCPRYSLHFTPCLIGLRPPSRAPPVVSSLLFKATSIR